MDINNITMDQNVSTLFNNIETFTQEEGTLGKAVSLGDKTLIPVISVSIGYGGGNSSGKLSQSSSSSSQPTANTGMDALGLGARISTDAVLIVEGENVSALPISNTTSAMNQLINKIPQMMTMGQGSQQQGQSQGQQGQQSQQGQQQGQQSWNNS